MLADCSFLPPLPQLACSILSTSYKYNFRALYTRGPLLGDSLWRETMMSSTTVHPSLVPGQSREGERENSFVHNRVALVVVADALEKSSRDTDTRCILLSFVTDESFSHSSFILT